MSRWKQRKSIDQDGNLTRYDTDFQITIKKEGKITTGEDGEKGKPSIHHRWESKMVQLHAVENSAVVSKKVTDRIAT